MSTEIINTINYDYPSCGGIRVVRGRTRYTIERESNRTGNLTGIKVTMAITPQRDEWDATDWEDAIESIIWGDIRNIYRDKRIISRGYVVE